MDRHRDPSAFDRAETLVLDAGAGAVAPSRHLTRDGAGFPAACRHASCGTMRACAARAAQIVSGAGPQSGLWPLGISGDLPIVLLLIDDADDIAHAAGGLTAPGILADAAVRGRSGDPERTLLVLCAGPADRHRGRDPHVADCAPEHRSQNDAAEGRVYALRADLHHARGAGAAARRRRAWCWWPAAADIGQQLDALPAPAPTQPGPPPPSSRSRMSSPAPLPVDRSWNSSTASAALPTTGANMSRSCETGRPRPRPGSTSSPTRRSAFRSRPKGSGHVWAENSRENQLTPWSNDPVTDPAGEAIYLHDLDTGRLWTPTALADPRAGHLCRAARLRLFSRFEHAAHGIDADMVQFVPLDDPVKITRLTPAQYRIAAAPPVGHRLCRMGAGHVRTATARHVIDRDRRRDRRDPGAQPVRAPPFRAASPLPTSGRATSATADRAEFLGPGGDLAAPPGCAPSAARDERPGARPLRGPATAGHACARRNGRGGVPAGPGRQASKPAARSDPALAPRSRRTAGRGHATTGAIC